MCNGIFKIIKLFYYEKDFVMFNVFNVLIVDIYRIWKDEVGMLVNIMVCILIVVGVNFEKVLCGIFFNWFLFRELKKDSKYICWWYLWFIYVLYEDGW